jgi:hypothetical protein
MQDAGGVGAALYPAAALTGRPEVKKAAVTYLNNLTVD